MISTTAIHPELDARVRVAAGVARQISADPTRIASAQGLGALLSLLLLRP